MRRFALLTYIGLALACFAGCHKCHHKHFLRACSSCCEPCGGGEVISGVVEGAPVPSSVILPASPAKGIPIIPGPATPQAPNVRISTPQG
jgi:hypothetical protein